MAPLLDQLNCLQAYYEKICLTFLKRSIPMTHAFMLIVSLMGVTLSSISDYSQATEYEPNVIEKTTDRLLHLFKPHHAMGGFSRHHKEMLMVTHQCFTIKEDDGRLNLLNMFDYNGAMHGFTEEHKVVIFQSVCKLPQRFHSSFKKSFLNLFDRQGQLLHQSEDIKVFLFKHIHESQHQEALIALIKLLSSPSEPWQLLSDSKKKDLITHVVHLKPLTWQQYTFTDFLKEFEEKGILYDIKDKFDSDEYLCHYLELTNIIQPFIYTKATSLKKNEQRILICIILLHSDPLETLNTSDRHCLIKRWFRDLIPIISLLAQEVQTSPQARTTSHTCMLYDELFEYFVADSTQKAAISELEQLD